ncbi:hypothetical protein ABT215_18435 [Streptomyces sp900105755]|uniref:hypothetical protein n=1 Tax=Streptomyces sp. 900105755 TaxID=3154389 RepID=UPI00331C04F2
MEVPCGVHATTLGPGTGRRIGLRAQEPGGFSVPWCSTLRPWSEAAEPRCLGDDVVPDVAAGLQET